MSKDIWRHIKVWSIASGVAYLVCVGLFVIRAELEPSVFNKPFFFLIEKVTASVVGISFLTGVTIFVELVSKIPIYTKLAEVPVALAIYCGILLYCVSWIWTYS